MPRIYIDIEPYKDELIDLVQCDDGHGYTYEELRDWLFDEHNISIQPRTIRRRFAEWGVRKLNKNASDSSYDEIKRHIWTLFFDVGLNDIEILRVLNRQGFNIRYKKLRTFRFQLGLKRRLDDPHERAIALTTVRQILEEAVTTNSPIVERIGYRLVRSALQQRNHHFTYRMVAEACRTVFPEAVARRRNDQQRRRGEYIVPGPNYIWSIDGYDKLRSYGIQIYACIDAYSRCIIWIYVGISNRTQVSVVRQYFDTVQKNGFQPAIVRSDRGTETSMLANAHWQLRYSSDSTILFEDSYLYGTSTANERIEAWWGQLSKGSLFVYRVSISYEYIVIY